MISNSASISRSRNPQSFDYYRCVEDHFENFVQIYAEGFERKAGAEAVKPTLGPYYRRNPNLSHFRATYSYLKKF